MYGYVRPLKGELRVREYENYRAVYCGLCHTLRSRGGFIARFTVNYDLTFLAMLLAGDTAVCAEKRRCPANLLRHRHCLAKMPALEAAADLSLVLAWWKLADSVGDEGPLRAVPARLGKLLLRHAYRRAREQAGDFDTVVRENLAALSRLEDEKCASLDRMAEHFAVILRAMAACSPDGTRRRILEQLLDHVGRIIYILDAADDLEEDVRRGRYNPLIHRFDAVDGRLADQDRETLRATLALSQEEARAALQLLETGPWSGILENIVCLGIPEAIRLVLEGKWQKKLK